MPIALYRNLAFWVAVEDYKSLTNKEDMRVKANELYKKYFNSESVYEINIDSELKKDLDMHMTGAKL